METTAAVLPELAHGDRSTRESDRPGALSELSAEIPSRCRYTDKRPRRTIGSISSIGGAGTPSLQQAVAGAAQHAHGHHHHHGGGLEALLGSTSTTDSDSTTGTTSAADDAFAALLNAADPSSTGTAASDDPLLQALGATPAATGTDANSSDPSSTDAGSPLDASSNLWQAVNPLG